MKQLDDSLVPVRVRCRRIRRNSLHPIQLTVMSLNEPMQLYLVNRSQRTGPPQFIAIPARDDDEPAQVMGNGEEQVGRRQWMRVHT